ncbi:MAG: PAS domain S-box protein [Thermodesulfobacteriota bacterium]
MELRPAAPPTPPPQQTPLPMLLTIAGAVFAAEVAVMVLLHRVPLAPLAEIFVDAALLTLLLFPTLYLFLYQRLAGQLRQFQNNERELAELRDFFQSTLDSIFSGVYVTDRHETIIFANRAVSSISGLPLSQIQGASLLTDFPEETLRHFRPCYLRARDTGSPVAYEALPIVTPTGRRTFQSGWLIPRLRDGSYDGMICTMEDVTSQKNALAALDASKQRYQDLFENANDAIFIVDNDHRYVDVNKKAVELFGFSREEFLGMRTTDVMASEPPVACEASFGKRGSSGHYERFISRQRTRDGRWLDIEVSSSAIIEDGRVVGSRDIVRDITGRKQIEEQLRQAQKMEAIGTLAGGIAHDFNNILYAIRGYTELSLAETRKGSAVHDNLQEIRRSAQRAADLVKQILTFSRKGAEEKHPLRLEPVVKEALKLIRGTLPTTIDIRQSLDPGCRPTMADLTQIHQVVINLCANAADAMEAGGVLTVRLEEVTVDRDLARRVEGLSPGDYVRLSVADTGHGMDQATMSRIFEPYFTTKGPGKGTGLGLATVHGIVSSHQGAIACSSMPGQGSTFSLYFPALPAGTAADADSGQETTPPRVAGHILVVDDEPSIVRIAEQALRRLDCQVTAFTNSTQALLAFQNSPYAFDAVLTDQTMPALTGLELARKMMTIRPDIPIILTTGYSTSVNEEQAKAAGIRTFLMKPLSIEELGRALHEALLPAETA